MVGSIMPGKTKLKAKGPTFFVPCALLFVSRRDDVKISLKGKKYSAIEILGPETSLHVATADKDVKREFLAAAAGEIKRSKMSAVDGYFIEKDLKRKEKVSVIDLAGSRNEDIRRGKYQFRQGGSYDGDWVRGNPHGEGTFVYENSRFEGWWNGDLKAGCGVYFEKKNGDWLKKKGGWKVDFHKKIGVRFVDPEPDNSNLTKSGLLNRDIELILNHGKESTYQKGHVILEEGAVNKNVYWISEGEIAITKVDPVSGVSTQIATVPSNHFFGELSVLDKSVITATVIASDNLRLVVLPLPSLLNLFEASPGLSKRFHRLIAISLAEKVRANDVTRKKKPGIATKASKGWGLVRKTVTFSHLLMDVALQKSVEEAENLDLGVHSDENPVAQIARRWLALWSTRSDKVFDMLSSNIIYLDPFAAKGLKGAEAVKEHVSSLFSKYPDWKWDVVEVFPHKTKQRSSLRLRLLAPTRRLRIWTMLLIGVRHEKITQIEFFYDREKLLAPPPSSQVGPGGKVNGSWSPRDAEDASAFGNDRDIEFRMRFELKDFNASILHDFDASMSINGLMEKHPGKLYLSEQFICFRSRVFGLDLKKVIAIVNLKEVILAEQTVKLQVGSGLNYVSYDCYFDNVSLAESAYAAMLAVHELCKVTGTETEKNQTTIDKFIRENQLQLTLPDVRLIVSRSEKGQRVSGPRNDESGVGIADDVYGRAISNYPHWSTIEKGNVIIDTNLRQGDPICDQFVVERMPNQIIFAVADGCNWGWKPRNAAFAASRRFIEYVESQQSALITVPSSAKIFFQGFNQAHNKIMEGNEANWWDVGTTTMIGGAIIQQPDTDFPWAFVAAGVGDCKAFHISFEKDDVEIAEITIGSRSGENITDAADCGGRLGPHIKGEPDLRNMDCWYQPMQNDDLVMICSDGVHDNLDPQHLGKLPSDFGMAEGTWEEADAAKVEEVKQKFAHDLLKKLLHEVMAREKLTDPRAVTLKMFTNHIIDFCYSTSKSSREFMENHPDLPQPHDYVKFPGKMDHTTCVFIRACTGSSDRLEQQLDHIVIRMRHPISGVPLKTLVKGNNKSLYFTGKSIVQWLQTTESGMVTEEAEALSQQLLNFRYIRPLGGFKTVLRDSFSIDTQYEFQVYQPIMTQEDWKNLLRVGVIQRYSDGEAIIMEGARSDGIYQIIKGTCVVVKNSPSPSKGSSSPEVLVASLPKKLSASAKSEKDLKKKEVKSPRNNKSKRSKSRRLSRGDDKDSVTSPPTRVHSHKSSSLNVTKGVEDKKEKEDTKEKEKEKQERKKEEETTEKEVNVGDDQLKDKRKSASSPSLSSSPGTIQLAELRQSDVFGEINVLERLPASASVVARGSVEVYSLKEELLQMLWVVDPGLEGRFYHYLASTLARRLKRAEAHRR
eukprot:TRINITY_DN2840_c0_g1_i2.p1 TRINITY_DN2840_c0_g1~~TRINITY_DN2840_c0_g1_i2.p1  ORF type:complete len:1486 (+),score=356.22 TRINITY_DN2840_c0_g1_i2:268-4458(+)